MIRNPGSQLSVANGLIVSGIFLMKDIGGDFSISVIENNTMLIRFVSWRITLKKNTFPGCLFQKMEC